MQTVIVSFLFITHNDLLESLLHSERTFPYLMESEMSTNLVLS